MLESLIPGAHNRWDQPTVLHSGCKGGIEIKRTKPDQIENQTKPDERKECKGKSKSTAKVTLRSFSICASVEH